MEELLLLLIFYTLIDLKPRNMPHSQKHRNDQFWEYLRDSWFVDIVLKEAELKLDRIPDKGIIFYSYVILERKFSERGTESGCT